MSSQPPSEPSRAGHPDGDLTDMLGELKVLLPGAQTLTAFLVILPFNSGFSAVRDAEKAVYAVTFLCSLLALILFTVPAAQHRLLRQLHDREHFKKIANRFVVAGLIPLSIALVSVTELVLSQILNRWISWAVAAGVGVVILALWWVVPIYRQGEDS